MQRGKPLKFVSFFTKLLLVSLLAFGLFKSYDFYQQNKKERSKQKLLDKSNHEKPFVILITASNHSPYCEKNLFSALTQNYSSFRILYIDDASTDGTFEKANALARQFSPRSYEKVTFLRNKVRKGSLACLYDAIHNHCQNHEIVLVVDGADFLAHENVLTKLNKVYAKSFTWMTYGNFLDYPSYRQIPMKCRQLSKNVVFNNSFRTHEMPEVHLKTFYAGLFKLIAKEDLLNYNHQFILEDGTLAYYIPLLEMAGKHASFINEVLYLHTAKAAFPPPHEYISYLKKLPKYRRLKTLPFEQIPPTISPSA